MNIYYTAEAQLTETPFTVALPPDESAHCIRVMRGRVGDTIYVTNGQGDLFEGTIEAIDSQKCLVLLTIVTKQPKRLWKLVMAVAPTKNADRLEWFVEKATEIGVDEIIPVYCEHSERTNLRLDRLQKILISAMKQSKNLFLPRLHQPMSFGDLMNRPFLEQKFIAYVNEKQDVLLKNCYSKGSDCMVLIGPEGDFSKTEIQTASQHNFQLVSLGNSVLRTETAAVVACNTIHLMNM